MKCAAFLAVAIVGCAQAPRTAPSGTRAVGHGGMGPDHEFPVNTKGSVMACLSTTRNGVEVDVQMTKDGGLVCYHAQDLSELTDCVGLVNAYELEHFEGNCYYRIGEEKHGILLLEDVLRAAEENHTVVLDCKLFAAGDWNTYLDDLTAALVQLIMNEGAQCTVNIECQVTEFLDKVKAEESGAHIFYYALEFTSGLSTATTKGYDGITISSDLITAAQVQQAQDSGLQVALFGIDAGDEHAALGKGADILQLDEP